MKPFIPVCCLVILLTNTCLAQNSRFVSDSLTTYIEKGMKDWQIPGLAIAIVKDGQVVFMKGFGERNIQTHEK